MIAGGSGKMPQRDRKDVGIPAEEFEKAFGDDYWDRPLEERFHLLLDRMLKVKPGQLNETEHSKNQRVHNRAKSRS